MCLLPPKGTLHFRPGRKKKKATRLWPPPRPREKMQDNKRKEGGKGGGNRALLKRKEKGTAVNRSSRQDLGKKEDWCGEGGALWS